MALGKIVRFDFAVMSKNCPDLPCQRFPGNTKNCQICQRFNIMPEIGMSKNCQIFLARDLEILDVEKLPEGSKNRTSKEL